MTQQKSQNEASHSNIIILNVHVTKLTIKNGLRKIKNLKIRYAVMDNELLFYK